MKQVTTRHKQALVVACVHLWVFYHVCFLQKGSSCPWRDRGAGQFLQSYLATGVPQECFSPSLLIPASPNVLQTLMKFWVISRCSLKKKEFPENCKRHSWAAAAAFHANTLSYLMIVSIPCSRWVCDRKKMIQQYPSGQILNKK